MNDIPSNLILGTAGHIDHGKSSLIKALTGVDPDRIPEEKRRGITIELGFARLVLPSGSTMGVVDVPGHEKFVRHMVAGATGVDVALLVIAADDGIMPQTVEHIAVLELLGVKSAVVALTKTDLVDEEWLGFMRDEIRDYLSKTAFAAAEVIPVSSLTQAGLQDLKEAIDRAVQLAPKTKREGYVRLPIDRVFTIQGFGTVVTGTLWSGILHAGDALSVLPNDLQTRARSIQMHGQSFDAAPAGNRVAVNLAGLSLEEVHPGDFLCEPASASVSDRFDAEFTYLDPFANPNPLKSGARIHVAHGTKEVLGRILMMDGIPSLNPFEHALVQIRLEEPLAVAYQDRFIVRSYSPMHVIGGGTILDAHPRRRTTLKPQEHALLSALDTGDIEAACAAHLELAELPEDAETVANACGLDLKQVNKVLSTMVDEASLVALDGKCPLYARTALLQKLCSSIEHTLLDFHTRHPNESGMSKEALRKTALPTSAPGVFDAVLDFACTRHAAVCRSGEVGHPKAQESARQEEESARAALMQALQQNPDAPADIDRLIDTLGLDRKVAGRALTQLVRSQRLVCIAGDCYYPKESIDAYKEKIKAYIEEHGPCSAAELKEAMGTTRKYAMPLLEYFDETGFTRRSGDLRSLIG